MGGKLSAFNIIYFAVRCHNLRESAGDCKIGRKRTGTRTHPRDVSNEQFARSVVVVVVVVVVLGVVFAA